jgi:pimeloyl-ACP methyl ester carboxylesterase
LQIDPSRIVIMGHSYGGGVAACAASRHPELIAAALIAPWDMGSTARMLAKLTPEAARTLAPQMFNDVDGRLTGADAQSLTQWLRQSGRARDLTGDAAALFNRPLLVATATRDDPDDQAAGLLAATRGQPDARLTERRFETDHGFNDQRIALTTFVLDWLATLPGAP